MQNLTLRSIKNESIKKMFAAVTSKENISRSEIAELTGLSLMTVGKIADAFLELDMITQVKEAKGGAGRKAGLISLKSSHYSVVLDLSDHTFTLSVIDFSLRLVDRMTYTYNNDEYYDENLYMFLKKAAVYLKTLPAPEKCIGIAVLIPGMYKQAEDRVISTKVPELNSISIKAYVEEVTGLPVSMIIKNVEAAAVSNIRSLSTYEDRVIIYMYMGECIDGAVYNRGNFVKGAHQSECDFGRMVLRYGEPLEERVRGHRSDKGIADELSSAVYNIITILDPDAFIIESELPRDPEYIVTELKNSLSQTYGIKEERMPEFLAGGTDFRHSVRGATIMLRDKWLDGII